MCINYLNVTLNVMCTFFAVDNLQRSRCWARDNLVNPWLHPCVCNKSYLVPRYPNPVLLRMTYSIPGWSMLKAQKIQDGVYCCQIKLNLQIFINETAMSLSKRSQKRRRDDVGCIRKAAINSWGVTPGERSMKFLFDFIYYQTLFDHFT